MLFVRQWLTDDYDASDLYNKCLFEADGIVQAAEMTRAWLGTLPLHDLNNVSEVTVYPHDCTVLIDHRPFREAAEMRKIGNDRAAEEAREKKQYEALHAKYGYLKK